MSGFRVGIEEWGFYPIRISLYFVLLSACKMNKKKPKGFKQHVRWPNIISVSEVRHIIPRTS